MKKFSDSRVKRKLFPISMFFLVYLAISLFTSLQMIIIGNFIDYKNIPLKNKIVIFAVWLLASAVFTLWTNSQITRCYQKPIEEFSDAARKVAAGDFSVYLPPHHTADKSTHLDVLFTDFNKMVEELGSIETLKTDFFSDVSHEIKTPLAAILNSAELLCMDGISEERKRECAEGILQASKRLSGLISNMLKLNKLEKQTIQPLPQSYDLCAQLCGCALQLEEMWERKSIDFTAEIEDRLIIEADEGLLELVWTNLLSNALKFTPDGGAVTLSQASDGERAVVTVSDTGQGMDEETMKHIYDKFYQGDSSRSTEGNGLGLTLVKRILQLSEGKIRAESRLGEGSTFTVTLPLKRSENL